MHRLDLTVGTSSCGLTISDARAEDNGDWECNVIGLDFLGQNRYKWYGFPLKKCYIYYFPGSSSSTWRSRRRTAKTEGLLFCQILSLQNCMNTINAIGI